MLPDIDSTFFHVLCGNLIVSNGSLYVYFFEINLRNLLYVIFLCGNLIVSNGSLYVYFFEINLRNLLYVICLLTIMHISATKMHCQIGAGRAYLADSII